MGFRNIFRAWYLFNTDTFQLMKGQFAPVNMTMEVKAAYAQHSALGMQKTILQFLHGEADKVSAPITLFNTDSLDSTADDQLEQLREWTKRDSKYKRPPILAFWVGDIETDMTDCVIESLSNITFGPPSFFGGMRQVTLTINLLKYAPYKLDEKGIYETRYHRVKHNDYFEILCQREYDNPLLGDVIRHRHPTNLNPQIGDVIKLPSVEAIRKEIIEPKSIQLRNSLGSKNTPTRSLRRAHFELRGGAYVSHIIKEA
jgi:hypothetical protein